MNQPSLDPKVKNVIIHIIVWLVYILYELITIFQVGGLEIHWCETLLNFSLYAVLFYVSAAYVLPKFYAKRRYVLLTLSIVIIFTCFTYLRYLLKVSVVPYLSDSMTYPFESIRKFMAETLWRGGYFIMLSFGYWFAKNLIKREREKKEGLRKIRLMEKGLKEAEIRHLKNQINPHFLFNTLNLIYDKVNEFSESAGQAIVSLSDLMRYSMKPAEVGSKAYLEDEVQHLKNYIIINQLRFNHKLHVNFNIRGNLKYRLIIPLLLITFVENCFKHGELFDPENEVSIDLDVTDDHLTFKTRNKKKAVKSQHFNESTGIGQENAIQRLKMEYGDDYSLQIEDTDTFHRVELRLNI